MFNIIENQREFVKNNIMKSFGVETDDLLEKGKWNVGDTKVYQGVTWEVGGFNAKGTPLWRKKKDQSSSGGSSAPQASQQTSSTSYKNPAMRGKQQSALQTSQKPSPLVPPASKLNTPAPGYKNPAQRAAQKPQVPAAKTAQTAAPKTPPQSNSSGNFGQEKDYDSAVKKLKSLGFKPDTWGRIYEHPDGRIAAIDMEQAAWEIKKPKKLTAAEQKEEYDRRNRVRRSFSGAHMVKFGKRSYYILENGQGIVNGYGTKLSTNGAAYKHFKNEILLARNRYYNALNGFF